MDVEGLRSDHQKVRTAIYEAEVYRILCRDDVADLELISRTIRMARSWVFVGAITTTQIERWPPVEEVIEVDRRTLEEASQRTSKIIVGAYDGEGFLVWQARDSIEK